MCRYKNFLDEMACCQIKQSVMSIITLHSNKFIRGFLVHLLHSYYVFIREYWKFFRGLFLNLVVFTC